MLSDNDVQETEIDEYIFPPKKLAKTKRNFYACTGT